MRIVDRLSRALIIFNNLLLISSAATESESRISRNNPDQVRLQDNHLMETRRDSLISHLQEVASGIVRVVYSDKLGNLKTLGRRERGKNLKTRKAKKSSRLRRPKTKAKLVVKKKRKPKQVVEAAVVPEDDVVYDYIDYVYDYDDYGEGLVRNTGKILLC